jgi:phosphatidylinositol alpha-mannosyltransferase
MVLYVGRLEPRKDAETLLRAVALLAPPAPRVCILGDGPSRLRLEALSASLHLESVQFLGAVSEQQKWAYLRRASCVVAPSRSGESFGIVLLEAMAAGSLPLAADNPGYRGVLANGGESLLFPVGDAAALAQRIGRALNDAAWRDEMGRWAQQHWPQYGWPAVASRVVETYRRALVRAAA